METAGRFPIVHTAHALGVVTLAAPTDPRMKKVEPARVRPPASWTERQPPRRGLPEVLDCPVHLGKIATVSPLMQDVLAVVARLARTDVTLTLTGETGTGKDVLAHILHDESQRRAEPFVVFDCSAVPANLVESEIFGHERGAFTGAVAAHVGAFERARGGTLFLDEIGELPLDLQPKLLRVIENRSFRRVGGTRDRPHDARVVAATNRDLAALVAARQFREDLYFRLTAAVVCVPPLRERCCDLPLLVQSLTRDLGHPGVIVPDATLNALAAHGWPGNVRELKNTLAAALAFVDGGVLDPGHLRLGPSAHHEAGGAGLERLPLGGQRLEALERVAIRQTLQQTGGNKTQAAALLGIAISTLYEKLRRYDIVDPDS